MSYLDVVSQVLAKEDENRKIMMKASNANLGYNVLDSIKALQPNITAASFLEDERRKMMNMASTCLSHNAFDNLVDTSRASFYASSTIKDYENHLFNNFYLASSSTDQIIKESTRLRSHQEQFFRDHCCSDAILESVRRQASIFDDLSIQSAARAVEANAFQLSKATLVWDIASSSLVNRVNDLGFIDHKSSLLSHLFEVPSVYTDFVSHTADLLANSQSNDISSRLRGSLFLAEHQLLEITNVYNSFISLPEEDDEELSYFSNIRVLKAPFRQQEEILNDEYFENENDIIALTKSSSTAQTVELTKRVLSLITQCNEAAKTSKLRDDIFKPTNRLMSVCVDLPWFVVTDKYRFGDLIDHLYFIFYEAAGKDKLRFIVNNGGALTEEECDLIWCIKHLRNKWIRHDADHGDKNDIKKSWENLSNKFQWLGLTNYPIDTDFQILHYKLLELAEDFLLHILQRLELK